MNVIKWIKKNEAIVLMMVAMVLLRLPSLYEPTWYGDENIYLAIGQGVRKGLVLYRDIIDFPNKPPFIYWMAAGVGNVFWFRLVLLFWNGLNVVVVWKVLKKLFGTHKYIPDIFTFLFILFTSLPFWEGNIANAEIFFILPTTVAVYFLLGKKPKDFLAGVALGLAFLFKIHVALDIVAIGLYFYIYSTKLDLRRIGKILLGFFLPVGFVLILHAMRGVMPWELFLTAAGSSNYVSAWQGQIGLILRGVGLAVILGLLFIFRKKVNSKVLFSSMWFACALFAVLLSGRPYPHYLIQIVPPLVLMLASFSEVVKFRAVDFVVVTGAIFLGVGAYVAFDFGTYPVWPYYKRFGDYVTNRIDETSYINGFDQRMDQNYRLAEYLESHTKKDEQIYIWGTEPGIYVLADRLPVGRLVTSFHVDDINEYERLGKEIAEVLPRYIVMMESEWREFPALKALVESKYAEVEQIGKGKIYRIVQFN